jgi:hypothetical protein
MSRAGFNPSGAKLKGVGATTCLRGFIAHYHSAPLASVVDKIHAAYTLTTAQDVTAGITQPDVPRVLSITGTMAGASLTGDVTIYGTDASGASINEAIALNNNATVAGLQAFKTITKIHFPAKVTTADTVKVGTTDALGLIHCLTLECIVNHYKNNVKETTAPTVTMSATVLSLNTVKPHTTINGDAVDILYII